MLLTDFSLKTRTYKINIGLKLLPKIQQKTLFNKIWQKKVKYNWEMRMKRTHT